jgi:hypothetical protein
MNRWRVGEDKGSKETDRCPLTVVMCQSWWHTDNCESTVGVIFSTPTSVKHSNQYTYTSLLTYFGV